jgi:hypothetical protein
VKRQRRIFNTSSASRLNLKSLDDAAFIEEQEEGAPDVTEIIGESIEKEEET